MFGESRTALACAPVIPAGVALLLVVALFCTVPFCAAASRRVDRILGEFTEADASVDDLTRLTN